MEAKDLKTQKIRGKTDLPAYVVDTHSFYWYLQNPDRLSIAADAIFRLAEAEKARLIIPAIVIAEMYYLTRKKGQSLSPSKLLKDIYEAPGFHLSELGRPQLEKLEVLDIPEMHDRLIAAEALVYKAPVVTRDPLLQNLNEIETVW